MMEEKENIAYMEDKLPILGKKNNLNDLMG